MKIQRQCLARFRVLRLSPPRASKVASSVFESMHKNKLGVRIMLGVIVGLLGVGMLLYLVPDKAPILSLPRMWLRPWTINPLA